MTDIDARRKRNPILASAGRVALGVVLVLVFAASALAADDFELAYNEFTADVAVSSTDAAAPTDVVSTGALSYDAVPTLLTFQATVVAPPSGGFVDFFLWDASTKIARVGTTRGPIGTVEMTLSLAYRLTPTAGSHTYRICATVNGGTGRLDAGSGTGGADAPGFLRVTLASPDIITQQDVDDAVAAGGSGSTVSLDESALDRLDLIWWGNWALVGLTFILIAAPRWFAAFRVTHGA